MAKIIGKKISKKRNVRKTKKPARASKAIKRVIRAEIARNIEDKSIEAYVSLSNLGVYGGATFSSANIFPVTPYAAVLQIVQGTSQSQRIGNEVKVKKMMFKGVLTPAPYDAVFNPTPLPQVVKMWFFYDRETPSVDPNPTTDWFQLGGASTSMTGRLTDMMAPVNTDRYRLLGSKIFKLGYAQYTGTGYSLPAQGQTNNDFKYNQMFSIDITKMMVQRLKYNDNNGTPTTRGVFCMIQACAADGTQQNNGYKTVNISYILTCNYEDA